MTAPTAATSPNLRVRIHLRQRVDSANIRPPSLPNSIAPVRHMKPESIAGIVVRSSWRRQNAIPWSLLHTKPARQPDVIFGAAFQRPVRHAKLRKCRRQRGSSAWDAKWHCPRLAKSSLQSFSCLRRCSRAPLQAPPWLSHRDRAIMRKINLCIPIYCRNDGGVHAQVVLYPLLVRRCAVSRRRRVESCTRLAGQFSVSRRYSRLAAFATAPPQIISRA